MNERVNKQAGGVIERVVKDERRGTARGQFGACFRKKPYDTLRAAKEGATNVRKRYGSKVKPYRCRFCPFYHLTTEGKW